MCLRALCVSNFSNRFPLKPRTRTWKNAWRASNPLALILFGTGYASIVSLLSLAPKSLKIDRQLVMPITKSLSERRLVAAIIEIGRALGIQIIAEGVETLEHARILREMGVDSLQGYFFAPPLSAEELERFAQKRDWMRHFID